MRSSDRTTIPDAWRSSSGHIVKVTLSAVLMMGLAAVSFTLAAVAWADSDSFSQAASKYLVLLGISMLVITVAGIAGLITRTRRTSTIRLGSVAGEGATVIPGTIPTFALYQLICVCFAVLFLGSGVEIALSAGSAYWLPALVLSCIGLLCASTPGLALAGRIRRARIVLTPQEIIYEGWTSRMTLPWSDVTDVFAASMQNMPLICVVGWEGATQSRLRTPSLRIGKNSYRPWKLEVPAPDGAVVLECPRLAADAHRLYCFLTYYAHTPAARAELGTPAALDRWAAVL